VEFRRNLHALSLQTRLIVKNNVNSFQTQFGPTSVETSELLKSDVLSKVSTFSPNLAYSSVCFCMRIFWTQRKLFDAMIVRRRPLSGLQPADPVVSIRHGTGSHFVTQRPSDPVPCLVSIWCSRRFTETREQGFFLGNSATSLSAPYFFNSEQHFD